MPSTSPDSDSHYELFVRRFTHHEPDLRRFIRSMLPTHTDADEVLQQTAIVIWKKFADYDPDTHFMKWACVIARFEALAYRRKMARDRLVFREDILDLLADEGLEELDVREAEEKALQACLTELPEKQRHLIELAYTPGVKVVDLATQAGASPEAYYMRLGRIRRSLMKCIVGKTQNPEFSA